MSKPVKELMIADYRRRFDDVENALLIDIRGIDANENNAFRIDLAKKDIRVTVIKNTLAKKAFVGTRLEALGQAMVGPSALAYGAESVVNVARELTEWARKIEDLELKAAVLDGQLFEGRAGVERLSRYPTREEAQGQVVQLLLTPGGEIVSLVAAPGGEVLAIVEAMIDKLEKGEEIKALA
ncbi:MAG: 50S ribosomal protein L10 [Planctomycetota bacterium]|jgi:large subunit ribosomal protein L10